MDEYRLARALGWFSLGLGCAMLLAPRSFGRWIGAGEQPLLMVLTGAREIATGIGVLARRDPSPWVEARVAGDLADMAMLGAAARSPAADRTRLAAATAGVAGVTALDLLCSTRLQQRADTMAAARASVTIGRPREVLYAFWRDPGNLPAFMRHLHEVRATGPNRWHWVAAGPLGRRIEWDSEITEDRPNELITWRSLEGSDFEHGGTVTFEPAPSGRGTIVRVTMRYRPPAGALGESMARIMGSAPGQRTSADLRAFKQVMEAGEIATTAGQPSGRSAPRRLEKLEQALRR